MTSEREALNDARAALHAIGDAAAVINRDRFGRPITVRDKEALRKLAVKYQVTGSAYDTYDQIAAVAFAVLAQVY
jgi:hypothetical protein